MDSSDVKIAFLVEGDSDKAFVEAIAPRIVGRDVQIHVVRVGGKAGFASTFANVAAFLEDGFQRVFVLVDADTSDPEEIVEQRERLIAIYRRYGVDHATDVCFAVPTLEAWLRAAVDDVPRRSGAPARRGSIESPSDIGRAATVLSIAKVRAESPSFDMFARALEKMAPSRAGRAADNGPPFGRKAGARGA